MLLKCIFLPAMHITDYHGWQFFFSLAIVRKGAAAYRWNEWVHLD
jgi:hypothetical protein